MRYAILERLVGDAAFAEQIRWIIRGFTEEILRFTEHHRDLVSIQICDDGGVLFLVFESGATPVNAPPVPMSVPQNYVFQAATEAGKHAAQRVAAQVSDWCTLHGTPSSFHAD